MVIPPVPTGLSGFSPGNSGWIQRAYPSLPGTPCNDPQARSDVVQLTGDYWGSSGHANLSILSGSGVADTVNLDTLKVGAIAGEDLVALVSADIVLDDATTRVVLLKAGSPDGLTFATIAYATVSTTKTTFTLPPAGVVLPKNWKFRFTVTPTLSAGKKISEFNLLYVPLRYGQYTRSL